MEKYSKTELRKKYLEKRKSLYDIEIKDFSEKIFNRVKEYFDLEKINNIHIFISSEKLKEVKTIRVKNLDIKQQINSKDTLDIAYFTLEYLDKNKNNIGFFDKKATYVLKKSPIKFVKEFKFYFINFDLKENTSEEVTK